jgi:hypothetical protein
MWMVWPLYCRELMAMTGTAVQNHQHQFEERTFTKITFEQYALWCAALARFTSLFQSFAQHHSFVGFLQAGFDVHAKEFKMA